ncbi:hypothetical protein A1O1_05699 [Capronia coronata CBS 617.96]|uniref:Uncharacterized protein n=1 Tax=Capronia coronata CBS 617.96 TaxID=1182541 RepID=W9Y6W2_9EURO|nr:uncharacterized protein A1O1_05699 [Capronia coronata CBS 617.96]EXJ85335.1 hypothetical protein A1O1_05699 [Capronia coronata CBS 617.96]
MHYSISLLAFAAIGLAFEYPDFVPLHRRQEPGTPLYECHANCGGVITQSRTEDFCNGDLFNSYYSACMTCALTYDIWQYYGNSVTTAGETCGLDTTPEPAAATTSDVATPTSDVISVSVISDVPATPAPTPSETTTAVTSSAVTGGESSSDIVTASTGADATSASTTSWVSATLPASSTGADTTAVTSSAVTGGESASDIVTASIGADTTLASTATWVSTTVAASSTYSSVSPALYTGAASINDAKYPLWSLGALLVAFF